MAADGASTVREITASGSLAARRSQPSERTLLIILGLVWLAVAGTFAITTRLAPARDGLRPHEIAFLGATLAAAVTMSFVVRRKSAWAGTRWMGAGLMAAALYQVGLWGARALGGGDGSAGFAVAIELVLLALLATIFSDVRHHAGEDGGEMASDVVVLAALIGGGVYLLLRDRDGAVGPGHVAITIGVALLSVLVIAGSGVLTLWRPSRIHLAFVGCAVLMGTAGILVDLNAEGVAGSGFPAAAAALASVSLAGLVGLQIVEPRWYVRQGGSERTSAQWLRPWLLTMSLGAACVWLGVALVTRSTSSSALENVGLTAAVAMLVALRTLANQRTMGNAAARLEQALGEREHVLASLRTAVGEVASSEARLRLLVDAAVDGIVELAADGTVVRANGGFLVMIGQSAQSVIGRRWDEVARKVTTEPGSDASLASLPQTGEAVLRLDGRTVYLEARSSVVPVDPPGSLLLIRDATASRVAEQTIRTLFKFLQDRDEDRTRYLKRSNVAIEAERNRIARDLHDGPIQGVAAASLSLEAVKLMIESDQYGRAAETLGSIRRELSEETENLRRLMSDLRPPLLEERGLVPAVRDFCGKFQEATDIDVTVRSTVETILPDDVETVAYRVIQEALSNVKKHAQARHVTVRVDGSSGMLEVEVLDDGRGFNPGDAREFLRRGKVGLASMRERTELGAGTFTVRSRPGAGTSVTATLPYELFAAPRP